MKEWNREQIMEDNKWGLKLTAEGWAESLLRLIESNHLETRKEVKQILIKVFNYEQNKKIN